MGRDWTNIKFEFENRNQPIAEAASQPRTQHEVVNDYITDRWDADNIPVVENIDVMFGGVSREKLTQWLSDMFAEFEFITRAAAVSCSDSAHAGEAYLFTRTDDGTAELIDTFRGAEGARGNDAAERLYDEYRIPVDASWMW